MRLRTTRAAQGAHAGPGQHAGPGRAGSLAAHPAFVPLVGLWGAALGGLAILVLPFSATARVAMMTGLSAFEHAAHFIMAAGAALAGGALAFGIAHKLSRAARKSREIPIAADVGTRPLHPVRDLGSASFDAPIETMPLGMAAADWPVEPEAAAGDGERQDKGPGQPAQSGSEVRRRLARALDEAEAAHPQGESGPAPQPECEPLPGPDPELDPEPETQSEQSPGPLPEPETQPEQAPGPPPEPAPVQAPVRASPADRAGDESDPLELDLARFAALPGRDAVWVEGPLNDDVASPAAQPRPAGAQGVGRARAVQQSTAIARLRETPTHELSLIQMVERLAAALHERQAAEHASDSAIDYAQRAARAGTLDDRDAALAEALKALGVLAGDAPDAGGHESPAPGKPGGTAELRAALARLHDMRGAA